MRQAVAPSGAGCSPGTDCMARIGLYRRKTATPCPTTMKEPNPCLACGACCANFRVSFFWGECQSAGGSVPDHLVEQISPHRVAMCGTTSKPVRCISLTGEVGQNTHCTSYELRSSTCREFTASWERGEHNPTCDAARAAWGLPPIPPPAAGSAAG